MKISKHFELTDFLRSQTAERIPSIQQKQYNPPLEIVKNLTHLAINVLDPIQDYLRNQNSSLHITSGYRCEELNRLVGGSPTSDHVKGRAADFVIVSTVTYDKKTAYKLLYQWIRNNLVFGQLIWEYGTKEIPAWLHVSYRLYNNSKQALIIGSYTNKKYLPYDTVMRTS